MMASLLYAATLQAINKKAIRICFSKVTTRIYRVGVVKILCTQAHTRNMEH